MKSNDVIFEDWGLINYKTAFDKQEVIFNLLKNNKLILQNSDVYSSPNLSVPILSKQEFNHLIFCQHPNVFTLGKSGDINHLLLDINRLSDRQIEYYQSNRGGDITYHGPGQLVCYPILDLEYFFTDLHRYMRTLEEAVIRTLSDYGLVSDRYKGYTGVWFDAENDKARKIAALGVRCSRWVVMHGLSLNVNTDLSYFNDIVPCGISNKQVTSMAVELGYEININEVQQTLKQHIGQLFKMKFI